MKGLPVVYPIFSLPHFPERICPRMYKYYLYNALRFLEDTEIGKWESFLSPEEIRLFDDFASNWLLANGFEPASARPTDSHPVP